MRTLTVFLTLMIFGCSSESMVDDLTAEEMALVSELGFDPDVALQIRRHGESLERLRGLNDKWEEVDANGLILMTAPERGEEILKTLRSALVTTGYTAYINDQGFGFGPDSIALLKNADPFVYLGIVGINGINYEIEHADVLRRLRVWDDQYGLNLVGAGFDWVQAEFSNPPNDWMSFAEEVYEFCPDVVDQGSGSIKSLASELRQINGVYLWWD